MDASTGNLKKLILFLIIITIFFGGCKKDCHEPEFRAIWLHQSLFDSDEAKGKEQIITLLNKYEKIGINNLFCYYTLPEENNLDWNFLSFITDEARKRGIGIHPVFCPGHEINPDKASAEHPGWLIRKMNGEVYPAYNMALPDVRKYWLSQISEALDYDIAGIHLDYIRFPVNQMFSYDSITCSEFKKEYGFSPLDVAHDGGSIIWCEWIKWNQEQITSMVREVNALIKRSGKDILLGADVFPDPAESETAIGQSWKTWASEGIIDFVCPMLYTDSVALFRKYLDLAIKAADDNCKVYPGIGIHSYHNNITPGILIEEINTARKEKTGGMAFFSGFSLNDNLIDTLRKTVFK